jgi:hypothetical protein
VFKSLSMIGLSHLSDEQLLVSLGFIMEHFRHHTRSVPQMLARIMLVEPTTVGYQAKGPFKQTTGPRLERFAWHPIQKSPN